MSGVDGRLSNHDLNIVSIAERQDNFEIRVHNHAAQIEDIGRAQIGLSELNDRISRHDRLLDHQQRTLGRILELARNQFGSEDPAALRAEADRLMDAFYVEFEDQFRGSSEQIQNRLSWYLPFVSNVLGELPKGEILDVGCGRGEWLQLMKENNFTARGIDMNSTMVAECIGQDLSVTQADALQYLRGIPDGTLSGITAFHVVEHLSMNDLLAFIDEVARTLVPGGFLILETPNPENLLVGSHYFYLDPTHLNPIPPLLLQFYVNSADFTDIQIDRLNADTLERPFSFGVGGSDELMRFEKFVNERFFVGPDYAMTARKSTDLADGRASRSQQ